MPEMREIMEVSAQSQQLTLEKLNYMVMSLDIQKPVLYSVSQMKDEASAKEMIRISEKTSELFAKMMESLKEKEGVGPAEAGMLSFLATIQPFLSDYNRPELVGNELRLSFDGKAYATIKQVYIELLAPSVTAARSAARRMQCTNNIKHLALAFHNYHDAFKAFPPTFSVDANGKPLHSWRVLILPFIEQTALYDGIKLDEPWDSEHNKQFHNVNVPTYQCPDRKDLEPGMTTYSVVVGKETPFGTDGKGNGLGQIADGTSNTFLIVERATPVCWMCPDQEITFEEACKGINKSEKGIGSAHTGGANFGICDGSVHFVSETIDLTILKAMFTKAGGESVALP